MVDTDRLAAWRRSSRTVPGWCRRILAAAAEAAWQAVPAFGRGARTRPSDSRVAVRAFLDRANVAVIGQSGGGSGARLRHLPGSNERDAEGGPVVMIRDLVLGAELAKSSKDRSDYLELRQKAQFPVPQERMVEAVREVLERHAERG